MLHLTNHIKFTTDNLRFLSFGFFMALGSSFGQTYFIGVFGPEIRQEFNLTQTSWSAIYMIGTLASALMLPWTGQQIDRISLRRYTVFVVIALVGATTFMALVPSVMLLVVAVFLLRQTGQGLMSHTGSTAMARYFIKNRGKAIAVSSLGFAVGEATLPFLMVVTITVIGWRASYGIAALTTLFIILPTSIWLLKGYHDRYDTQKAYLKNSSQSTDMSISWSRQEVLKDVRFYILLPAASAPSLIVTALFFHHLSLAELKAWDPMWFTGSYWVFAIGSVIAMLTAGPLIDRHTAVRVLPTFLMPLAIALFIVWAFDNAWWSWPYLFLVGVTTGFTHTGLTALWAEIYGTKHLGAIKSLYMSISVFASALGPLAMGILMDLGISIETTCAIFAAYCLVTSWLLVIALREYMADTS